MFTFFVTADKDKKSAFQYNPHAQTGWVQDSLFRRQGKSTLCSAMMARVNYCTQRQGRCTLFSNDRKGVLLQRATGKVHFVQL